MLAIYCRTSKNKKEGVDKSIPSQKKLGVEFAQSMGWEYEIFVDEGISGSVDDLKGRPGFMLMLDLIKKKKIKAVYCIDQSRIERNSKVWIFFAALCVDSKCEFYPGGQFFDLTIPENKFLAGMLSLANTFFSEITSQKVKIANEIKVREGKTHGILAYGYDRDPATGYYVINENEGKNVRRIFQMSFEGIGVYSIANVFNQEGVPTKFNRYNGEIKKKLDKETNIIKAFSKKKVVWRGNVIHDMIRNPLYKGKRKWNELELEAPVIIEPEIWDRVNQNLDKNKKNKGRKEIYRYLLNGLLYCEHCGMDIKGKNKLRNAGANTYKCKSIDTPLAECDSSRALNISKLDTFIIKHLFHSKQLKEMLVNQPKEKGLEDKLNAEIKKHNEDLENTTKKVNHLYNLLLDPDWEGDEKVKEELIASKSKKIKIEQSLDNLNAELLNHKTNFRSKRVKNTIENFKLDMKFDGIKKSVHSLVERISIHHTKLEKSGYFLINIKYRGFEEESIFMTNWQGMKWYWLSHYRRNAITEEDLAEDKERMTFLLKKKKVKDKNIKNVLENFKGSETWSSMAEIISLEENELVKFD